MQADRAAQELPSLVAPISRGLNAAVERLAVVEHTCLSLADAVQAPDLEKALARWGSQPACCAVLCCAVLCCAVLCCAVLMHVSPALHSTGLSASHTAHREEMPRALRTNLAEHCAVLDLHSTI